MSPESEWLTSQGVEHFQGLLCRVLGQLGAPRASLCMEHREELSLGSTSLGTTGNEGTVEGDGGMKHK